MATRLPYPFDPLSSRRTALKILLVNFELGVVAHLSGCDTIHCLDSRHVALLEDHASRLPATAQRFLDAGASVCCGTGPLSEPFFWVFLFFFQSVQRRQ